MCQPAQQPDWAFKRTPVEAAEGAEVDWGARVWWEAAVLSLCQHLGEPEQSRPVVTLHGWVMREGSSWLCRDSDQPDAIFGMQRCSQTLDALVSQHAGGLDEQAALPLAFHLACALRTLHECDSNQAKQAGVQGVLHNAVQPDHVLLAEEGDHVILCGLGNAALLVPHTLAPPWIVEDGEFTAPEIVAVDVRSSKVASVLTRSVDAWGFATTVLFMLTGALGPIACLISAVLLRCAHPVRHDSYVAGNKPYSHIRSVRKRIQAQVDGDMPYAVHQLRVSAKLKTLLGECLNGRAHDRPSMQEITHRLGYLHSWGLLRSNMMLQAENDRLR